MSDMTLHLTLTREWFDKIAIGFKAYEYRRVCTYWAARLGGGRRFREVEFKNGYDCGAPRMCAEWRGMDLVEPFDSPLGLDSYRIKLGEIREIANWTGPLRTKRRPAPWPDYNGQPIYDLSRIEHPDGMGGWVVYDPLPRRTDEDRWFVHYEDDPCVRHRLVVQVGKKGQAVVVPA